jgi:hypothetical protein
MIKIRAAVMKLRHREFSDKCGFVPGEFQIDAITFKARIALFQCTRLIS